MNGPTLGWLCLNLRAGLVTNSEELINPVSIDTRTLQRGDTFWALEGSSDGHQYVRQAFLQGAKAAVVSANWARTQDNFEQLSRCIIVEDTKAALTAAGTSWRKEVNCKILGITGSNGKTSTKEIVARLLKLSYRVSATEGNLNNRLGVPLTLLRLNKDTEIGVIEMGASEPGEIGDLCRICSPTHGVVTSIGRAHMEGFGTLAALAQTKGQLYDYVAESGVSFVPLDDPLCRVEASAARQAIGYSFSDHANNFVGDAFQGVRYSADDLGLVSFCFQDHTVKMTIPGHPAALSALCALTISRHFGVQLEEAARTISEWKGAPGRGQIIRSKGLTIIDDSYNANPTSMRAALQTLCSMRGRRIAILGDMAELGNYSDEEHTKLVNDLRSMTIDKVILVGAKWPSVERQFIQCESASMALEGVRNMATTGDTILVKGSRSVGLEQVVNGLTRLEA